ncbi:MAG: FIST C-terminal domain-containing protein [Candidatus Omnitrophica bacterium]|nr:FIST C-terminal domain-containing protein [Candidatus Omnitrophota bacterium]MDE2222592.1 FIST C-terminal domain-containing protein [Candidatus Omnitrophota bacterium]
MEFVNRITEADHIARIIDDLLKDVQGDFDLGILYLCPWPPYDPVEVSQALISKLKVRNLICCTCAGIIGSGREIEGRPSASLMLARMPGVKISPCALTQTALESLKQKDDWYALLEVYPNEQPSFLVFADPFAFDGNTFLAGLNQAYPGRPAVGGLASAASGPGENILVLNGEVMKEGLIGVALTGNVKVETVVSQGCRPIGETYIVTKAQHNIIFELAGRPFYKVLEEVLNKGTDYDRHLAHEAIFIGIAMNEYKDQFKRGDFLIRGVMGLDPESGAGAVGDYMRVGQTVQFHLRDAMTANEDLHELLKGYRLSKPAPHGTFVFSCNGRGMNLFKEPDHDIKIIQEHLGPVPAAGFFCAGEIGPVGGVNFLHGFTSSMALFYPQQL